MNENKKLMSGIKSKLIAAVCMLLVAVIMVVSSTYAWFTLSTAPEVTGITTAVGANGALEIALLPLDGSVNNITSPVGASGFGQKEKNLTWGNLLDLSGSTYGLDSITLYPSTINPNTKDEYGVVTSFSEAMLSFPEYGADGRVDKLVNDVSAAVFDNGFSLANSGQFGVRAVGSSSGLSPREIRYRDARAKAVTAIGLAQTTAANTLKSNGGDLADIAMKHATSDGTETYSATEIIALKNIVNNLLGTASTKGAFRYIEEAAMNLVLAYLASAAKISNVNIPDEISQTVEGYIDEEATLETFIAEVNTLLSQGGTTVDIKTLIQQISDVYVLLYGGTEGTTDTGAIDELTSAKDELDNLSGDNISWRDISNPMTRLLNISVMEINGIQVALVKEKVNELIQKYTEEGALILTIPTGAGVLADIADCCGDYQAYITLSEVKYGDFAVKNVEARMKTVTSVTPPYLVDLNADIYEIGKPAASEGGDKSITEFYGYIIDLAFRTNAASSNLLLQSNPIDRIYDDNSNDETMGHGASMTFALGAGVTSEMAIKLMSSFRIVFFTPDTDASDGLVNNVLAIAKLDTREGHLKYSTAGEITAYMYLVDYKYEKDVNNNILVDNAIKYYYNSSDSSYYLDQAFENKAEDITDARVESFVDESDAVITALPQKDPTAVSVLVYIDGENIENADVAATAYQSLTGTMNLQFASDADLIPAEDGNLHTQVTVEDKIVKMGESVTLAEAGATSFTSDNSEKLSVTNDGVVTLNGTTSEDERIIVTARNSEGKIIKKWSFTINPAE